MRNIYFFLSIIILLISSNANARERVIERPVFNAWSGTIIEIDKVVLTDTETVLHIQAFFRPNYWINIPANTFLIADGTKYKLLSSDGITIDEKFFMPESGQTSFTLTFPPIPESVNQMDFIEEVENGFKVWGIQLKNKTLPKPQLPNGIGKHSLSKDTALPTWEFKKGKATLKGKLLGYNPEINQEMRLIIGKPTGTDDSNNIAINEDGSFSTEIDVISPTPCAVYLGDILNFFVAPGEETIIYINLPEMYRSQSRLRKDEPATGKVIYYDGYMAAISSEFNDNKNLANKDTDVFKDIIGKDIIGVRDYFFDEYNEIQNTISASDLSKASKQILSSQAAASTAMNILYGNRYIVQSKIENKEITMEEAGSYFEKLTLPENYYDGLEKLAILNTPQSVFNITFSRLMGNHIFNEQFSKALGTDKGIFFELSTAAEILQKIDNFTPLTQEDKTILHSLSSPAFLEIAETNNAELLAKIEANKKKTGFKINETGEVANEDLLASMLAPFRGKVILVDFWATWCGPCIMANKTMAPMKEELKDKDIVYLYIAGENSPLKTWENMTPDIPGEHFRLTDNQWNYLTKSINSNGVPTYLIVDKEGGITYKTIGFPGVETMKNELEKVL